MTATRSWIVGALTAASLALGSGQFAHAQDPPKDNKDEGLERLLEKLDQKARPGEPGQEKKAEDKKDGDAEKKVAGAPQDQVKDKPAGEVASKDQNLDKLLENLGQSKDKPAPDDKKPAGPGAGPDEPMPPQQPGQPGPDDLKGADKDLDFRLKEATGKKDKPKNQRQRKAGEETGPLGQVIKEMRDVEERLGQPDTGEETRKKQERIVKNLDTLIEQMKNAPGGSQGMKMIRQGKKPGDQAQNGPPSNQPGASAEGVGAMKPKKPEKPKSLAEGLAKEIWGHLQNVPRDEMANVLNEIPLPSKEELIRLYYLSLSKKNSAPQE